MKIKVFWKKKIFKIIYKNKTKYEKKNYENFTYIHYK
jgi:hypothetical protein